MTMRQGELPLPTQPSAMAFLRQWLPDSTTRFAGTTAVPVESAVSTGVNESEALVRTSESRSDSEDVASE